MSLPMGLALDASAGVLWFSDRDNAAVQTEDRFAVLEAVYDKISIERLTALGVGPGWRCLEVVRRGCGDR